MMDYKSSIVDNHHHRGHRHHRHQLPCWAVIFGTNLHLINFINMNSVWIIYNIGIINFITIQ